ncbi:UDP-N-acetylglucosamine 2-epimerase [Campylobacter blaseri]|uniref:UDP-N-acetylglucosamine 2-epimerase (Non-hydrolyzing) n=1 Tax=Campylobacter blaseri TaxID=2042961 RepID=A0A2P8R294_9BACT|nr:UDP-N-acetylglucosamine 2-epimerase (non-hydrolyzing) [Campylobacter blaseri]PSM52611.1 UDP-N-acetylglucosamine 2-epimerase (non-hydrolyzing) [Campylobacter blaseri]PSM54259.1 UDP-N-acetylglucosamine 2-epimerase (non-hydrolyzing) [Campylobacter blaseri]QKF85911.1 UDP-N-acetylglucosamine 2-epimerase [Campylobacter blaseri]
MKILTILGARPQFIKAGSVSRQISKYNDIKEVIVHTGQHYDTNMSDIFFDEMKIKKPDYFLGIGGKSHGAMTGQMIEKIEEVAIKENPDFIIVYGDTNSTLAGAIVSSKLHIKLVHIEAGLRSFNMQMPEEVNRILTDRVSNLLFCPTDTAVKNLKNENFPFNTLNFRQEIYKVGDVMQDGAMFYRNFATKPSYDIKSDYILCTIHRAENTDDVKKLTNIFESLNQISKDIQIILPLHPRTKKMLTNLNINTHNLTIIEPVGYLEMVWLIDNCSFVMTDSGGLQKEAYFFKKPCITLRDETEWVELVECGANTLTGANKEKIINAYKNVVKFKDENLPLNLYGGGKASENIVKELLGFMQ